jgi:glycine dehydrogenase
MAESGILEADKSSVNLKETSGNGQGLSIPLDGFARRHIGPNAPEREAMLKTLGCADLQQLMDRAVPAAIRLKRPLDLPPARSEEDVLTALRSIADGNVVYRSYLGMGYSDCITPAVIKRNVLENPGWYTQYTPYQAEIAQGRLEALLTFQTMVIELTGLAVANASLLDEATAAAEAMTMAHALKPGRNVFLVSETCHPQTIEVVRTRAAALGIKVQLGDPENFKSVGDDTFGVLVQYPDTYGSIHDFAPLAKQVHSAGALFIVAADLLSLTLLRPPGEFGADVTIGSSQRFGVPLGYGGPHAAFFATRDEYKRHMPGRIVGVSKDAQGRPALRLALQTREQHIRREKATSNICTAQALLANISALYACYHGPVGLTRIAHRVRSLALKLSARLRDLGVDTGKAPFFDTVRVFTKNAPGIIAKADEQKINLRLIDRESLSISLDETTTEADVRDIIALFEGDTGLPQMQTGEPEQELPPEHVRTSSFLTDPVFQRYQSETEMMRYLKRLETKDLSLTTSMIPLGSCTMKLNAAFEMAPVTWPEFDRIHPFAPLKQARGYQTLFHQLEQWLSEITGFAGVSLQPNAGSQGEYAGLLVIRAWHEQNGKGPRTVCLIPTSAHGTNPASAVMAGMKVVPVACDKSGNIEIADLRAKAEQHRAELAALMVTYPSTHGVFEETILEICRIIHENGGQVYMDGANLNAQVGLCRPADLGADVCHLNLHKTFCIPHGGGGPGMGPIGVAEHLVEFLPGHPVVNLGGENPIGPVSAAPWGSASILPISWAYIAAMGADGLLAASQHAILNANYVARRLSEYFPVLYRGPGGFVAHECILDLRQFKSVTVEDVAKRLMDYGFHAPTVSWPVPGTMMIEPTESESKAELDRFCEALMGIHGEIQAIEQGQADKANNLLKNAPHTAAMLAATDWPHAYSREAACFPASWTREHKFWPSVARIDNVYGDRNLVCSCEGMEAYKD